MSKRPLAPPGRPWYVDVHGEPIDIHGLRRAEPAAHDKRVAPGAEPQAPTAALEPSDIDTAFDALCLAGCARGKTWLLAFLRALERQSTRGVYFNAAEVSAALWTLRAAGRIVDAEVIGFDVTDAVGREHLPRLLAAAAAKDAWRAWARSSATYGQHLPVAAGRRRKANSQLRPLRAAGHGQPKDVFAIKRPLAGDGAGHDQSTTASVGGRRVGATGAGADRSGASAAACRPAARSGARACRAWPDTRLQADRLGLHLYPRSAGTAGDQACRASTTPAS